MNETEFIEILNTGVHELNKNTLVPFVINTCEEMLL
jgi:hypothetical protein